MGGTQTCSVANNVYATKTTREEAEVDCVLRIDVVQWLW